MREKISQPDQNHRDEEKTVRGERSPIEYDLSSFLFSGKNEEMMKILDVRKSAICVRGMLSQASWSSIL